MGIKPEIFKAYDVRGKYPREINEGVARQLGRTLPRFFRGKKKAVIGYDMRLSSRSLERALVAGLCEAGANVIRVGMVPTPVVSFAVLKLKADCGVVVSASHSPGNVNGFKIVDSKANQIGLKQGLGKIVELMRRKRLRGRGQGIVTNVAVLPRYASYLVRKFKRQIRPLRVVADYGNGVGAVTAGRIFKNLKIKNKNLFAKPDGRFPNHDPNPHDPRNFKWLQIELRRGDYDLGIFFDGDADRAVFFDHRGNSVRPDIVAGIFALDILKRHAGAEIYHDLRFSKAVVEEIKRAGGTPIKRPVGSPNYKVWIPERKQAWLGAELSGHAMFRDFWGIDDGLYAALKLMEVMSKTRKPLGVLALPFKRYAQSGEINIAVKNPNRALRKIAQHFRGGRRSRLDGLSVEYNDWWFNVRPSHTEPVIRLSVEARDSRVLRKRTGELLSLIEKR